MNDPIDAAAEIAAKAIKTKLLIIGAAAFGILSLLFFLVVFLGSQWEFLGLITDHLDFRDANPGLFAIEQELSDQDDADNSLDRYDIVIYMEGRYGSGYQPNWWLYMQENGGGTNYDFDTLNAAGVGDDFILFIMELTYDFDIRLCYSVGSGIFKANSCDASGWAEDAVNWVNTTVADGLGLAATPAVDFDYITKIIVFQDLIASYMSGFDDNFNVQSISASELQNIMDIGNEGLEMAFENVGLEDTDMAEAILAIREFFGKTSLEHDTLEEALIAAWKADRNGMSAKFSSEEEIIDFVSEARGYLEENETKSAITDPLNIVNYDLGDLPDGTWIWPVARYDVETNGFSMSDGYSYVSSPFHAQRSTGLHQGVDIAAAEGTGVYAPADGFVTYSDFIFSNVNIDDAAAGINCDRDLGSATGNYVRLNTYDGYFVKFMHLSSISVAQPASGEVTEVSAGDEIGKLGNTGCSTGAHLHFQVDKSLGTGTDPFAEISSWTAIPR